MRLRHTHDLSDDDRAQLFSLLVDAFDGSFDADDFDHALGGIHVVADDESGLLGHASVVQRQVMVDDGSPMRCGYVEAVAVASRARRRGIGAALMAEIDDIILRSYALGALSASDAGRPLYLRRGWQPWEGSLGALTPSGIIATPDDEGGVLILPTDSLQLPMSPARRLVCDWRRGDLW